MVREITFLRHGIRLDVDEPIYHKHYLKRAGDIPLSPRGIKQAQETGEYLKENEKIDWIFVSPFFRTLQTAQIVAEQLHIPIHIEHGFIEHLNKDWFPSYPEVLSLEEASDVFPNVNKEYQSLVQPTFPEMNEADVFNRLQRTIDSVMKNYSGNILIIGHWASVESSAMALVYPEKLTGFNVEMCALNKFVLKDTRWNLVHSSTGHLSEKSLKN